MGLLRRVASGALAPARFLAKRFSPIRRLQLLGGVFVVLVGLPVALVGLGRFVDPPATGLMMLRMAEGYPLQYRPVPLARVSPHLVAAVIAAEDALFCSHGGFDADAILSALAHNAEGGSLRGGSTISQQTAKNVYLWPARSWLRKGLEAYLTVLMELIWPKRRILEIYLSVAEWGPGVFGAQAAAERWFGKDAADLDAGEAARLAATLPSPNRWRPDAPSPYVRRRAASIRARASFVRAQGLAACALAPDESRGQPP